MTASTPFGPWHPPVEFTKREWQLLQALHDEGGLPSAARTLGWSDEQARQILAFLAEKLRRAALL